MKTITQYQSNDGKNFDTEKKCLEYEELGQYCINIDNILSDLNGLDSVDGKLFRHGIGEFREFKIALVRLVISELKEEKWSECEPMDIHPTGVIGRILGDSSEPRIKLLNNLWHRLQCIDAKGVEYEQPYFVHGNYIEGVE